MIYGCILRSPIGALEICEENGSICRLSLLREESDALLTHSDECRSDVLYEACTQINEYFAGKRTVFNLPVNCEGTTFQKSVWAELQKIPYGETRSYEDIAAAIGKPNAARAVGQANNRNPVMIIVPCHRVINKNGKIAGFACGTEIKKYLLRLEKIYLLQKSH